jgi:hypothetical protein
MKPVSNVNPFEVVEDHGIFEINTKLNVYIGRFNADANLSLNFSHFEVRLCRCLNLRRNVDSHLLSPPSFFKFFTEHVMDAQQLPEAIFSLEIYGNKYGHLITL